MPLRITTVDSIRTVEKLSPFRYPGGKTWLVPIVRSWLKSLDTKPAEFVEPFAGGASVGLAVANEHLASLVILAEKDDDIAAVWMTILSDDSAWLAKQVSDFKLDSASVSEWLSKNDMSVRDRAFRTILANRVSHGGKLAPGSGLLNKGENGHGLHSRWYAKTLSDRILKVGQLKNRIFFQHGDGIKLMESKVGATDDVFFIDPPYAKAGSRLYRLSEMDYEALFRLAARLKGSFLMTYDDSTSIKKLALDQGFEVELIVMKNTQYRDRTELLIGRNLSWFRDYVALVQQPELFQGAEALGATGIDGTDQDRG